MTIGGYSYDYRWRRVYLSIEEVDLKTRNVPLFCRIFSLQVPALPELWIGAFSPRERYNIVELQVGPLLYHYSFSYRKVAGSPVAARTTALFVCRPWSNTAASAGCASSSNSTHLATLGQCAAVTRSCAHRPPAKSHSIRRTTARSPPYK
jgi:hypothetical protein